MNSMKQHHTAIALFLLLLFPLYASAQGFVSVNLHELKETRGHVQIAYEVKLSPASIASGQGLCITPMLHAGDSLRILPRVTVLGSNKSKVITRWLENHRQEYAPGFIPAAIPNDTTLFFSLSLPYVSWMDSAHLSFHQELLSYRGQNTMSTYILGQQLELSPRESSKSVPRISLIVPPEERKTRSKHGKAFLDFPVGSSDILPDYGRNPGELPKIDDLLRELTRENKDLSLQKLYIEGYASPEGPYQANAVLAEKRALAFKDYIKNKFGLHESQFCVTSISEDWQGAANLVQASDLPDKDQILEVISATGIFQGREKALMNLKKGVAYRRMLDEIFPGLRRVEYRIDYSVRDYNLSETQEKMGNSPGDLSQLELYNLAMSYGAGSEEYQKILLETIPHYFSENGIANNNAAAVLILKGELSAARRYLDKAGRSAAGLNNTGVLFMLEGDPVKAEEYFKQAQQLGSEEAVQNLNDLHASNLEIQHKTR